MSINALRDFHGLHDFHVRDVCRYLQDCDVKALGAASKELQPIAAAELDSRDEELERLLAPYTATRMFNTESVRKADLLAVGELHSSQECQAMERDLVNHLTWRGFVVLVVEEEPPNVYNYDIFKRYFIKDYNLSFGENIYLTGWDNKCLTKLYIKERENEKNIKSITENQSLIIEINKELNVIFDNFNHLFDDLTDEEQRQIGNLTEQKAMLEENEWHAFWHTFPLEVVEKFVKLQTLQANAVLLRREQAMLDFLIKKSAIELEAVLPEEFVKVVFDHDEGAMDRYRIMYGCFSDEWTSTINREFPIRTISMVNTVKNMKNTIDLLVTQLALRHRPKIVLIAGCDHLEQNRRKDDNRFNLDRLYQELNNHKAVILMPTAPLAASQKRLEQLDTSQHAPLLRADARRAYPETHSSEE